VTQSIKKAILPQAGSRLSWQAKVFLQLLLPMFFCHSLFAQETKLALRTAEQIQKGVEAPIKVAGIPYKSGSRRDPFLNPLLLKKSEKEEDVEVPRGLPPSGIAGTYIAQAILQGISIRDGGRIAILRGADTRAYFLKEGDRLFDGYLRSIETDSITLVRETKLKSGKNLTQDVTKRLRTP
jgi:hypothetical protein